MLPITVPYQHELPTHSFEVFESEGLWLQRQAHTLRLEGDYVGAQRLERNLSGSVESFVLPSGTTFSIGQDI